MEIKSLRSTNNSMIMLSEDKCIGTELMFVDAFNIGDYAAESDINDKTNKSTSPLKSIY